MRTIKEVLDQVVEVKNFEYAIEMLRKMHAINFVQLYFDGHQSIALSSDENRNLDLKRAAIEYQTEIVAIKANDLRRAGIDPGNWGKEFEK